MKYRYFRQLQQRGVTLIEMLIVMGLLSMFLVVLTTVFTTAIDSQTQTQSYSAVTANGRYLLARLDYDIGRASAVITPSSLGATSSSLQLTISGSTYTYALSGGSLQLTDPSGTDNLSDATAQVSAVSFQLLGNSGGTPSVRYSFTLTSSAQTAGGPLSQTFTSTAGLR